MLHEGTTGAADGTEKLVRDLFLRQNCRNFNRMPLKKIVYPSYQMEWLWQKSSAEMICLKNLLASLGVSLPFFTR